MPNTITENRKEQGFVAVVALLILVVLTIIGIAVTQTSSTDIKIASNVIPYKQDFYVAEGGQHRERAELGRFTSRVPYFNGSILISGYDIIPGRRQPYAIDRIRIINASG